MIGDRRRPKPRSSSDVVARSAELPVARRLLGRVVRPVSRPRARARGRGRGARRCGRARQGRRRCETGSVAADSRQRHSRRQGVPRRQGRGGVHRAPGRGPAVEVFLDELLAPPRADALIDELRASGELAGVVAALDAGDVEGALRLIVEAVPAAAADERERLREVAVALFERLGADEALVGTYRRRLAAALY